MPQTNAVTQPEEEYLLEHVLERYITQSTAERRETRLECARRFLEERKHDDPLGYGASYLAGVSGVVEPAWRWHWIQTMFSEHQRGHEPPHPNRREEDSG